MNSASLDPYEYGGLPMNEGHTENIQDLYVPFQQIVPDTREGWDENGDWHAVEHTATEALGRAITPYRWASYLQDAVIQYCSTMDYSIGRSERCDIVQDIVSDRMERCATMEERYALEDALQLWFRIYGRNGI